MQFRNLSSLKIPKDLWVCLAKELSLDKNLPQAAEDGILLYTNKTLRVVINKSIDRGSAQEVVLGSYSCGSISIFPCPKCTLGSLTLTYLHEICHAWLDQYHENIYAQYDTCVFCEEFAYNSYKILGGEITDRFCWCHNLSTKQAVNNIKNFSMYVKQLVALSSNEILKKIKQKELNEPE